MITMRMGDENGRNRLAFGGREQCLDMRAIIWAGINHRDFAVSDKIAACAGEGERAFVGRKHATHEGRQACGLPDWSGWLAIEGNVRRTHLSMISANEDEWKSARAFALRDRAGLS
jgi:hypothetical protein